MMTLKVRPLEFTDFAAWLPLWTANNLGINDEKITAQTWQRLCDPDQTVYGFGAFEGKDLVGILHYILHPTTGHISHACYMQDLFTSENHRRKGIAKKLLRALLEEYRKQKWARIYWIAEQNNAAAQKLYEDFGKKLEFSFHVLV